MLRWRDLGCAPFAAAFSRGNRAFLSWQWASGLNLPRFQSKSPVMRVAGTSVGGRGLLMLVVGLWLLASAGPAGAQFFGGVEDAPRPPGNVPGTVPSPPPAASLLPPSSGPTGRGDRVAPPTGPVLQSLPPPNVNPVPAPAQAVPTVPAG